MKLSPRVSSCTAGGWVVLAAIAVVAGIDRVAREIGHSIGVALSSKSLSLPMWIWIAILIVIALIAFFVVSPATKTDDGEPPP